MNERFGKEASDSEDAHRPLRAQDDLKRIFAWKVKRKLSKDLTFHHRGILYLIQTKSPNRLRHAGVEVHSSKEEPIEVLYNGIRLEYKKWSEIIFEESYE